MASSEISTKEEERPSGERPASPVFGSCPLPIFDHQQIVLGHGSGGKLTADLIDQIFLARVPKSSIWTSSMTRQCLASAALDWRLRRTPLWSRPIFFPGGDIGRLAVHGTVNDLAMSGARPLYLSAAFILEEGLAVDDLRRVVESMRAAAARGRGTVCDRRHQGGESRQG